MDRTRYSEDWYAERDQDRRDAAADAAELALDDDADAYFDRCND